MGNLRIATAVAAAVVAITAVYYHSGSQRTYNTNELADSHKTTLERIIKDMKFPLFQEPIHGKAVTSFTKSNSKPVQRVTWASVETTREIVESREPAVLLGSSASHWKALHWDLWELSVRLPILMGVAFTNNPGPLLLENEREEGGMITVEGLIEPCKLSDDFFFINFLLSFKNAAIRMIYYSNFLVFGGMLNVIFIRYLRL